MGTRELSAFASFVDRRDRLVRELLATGDADDEKQAKQLQSGFPSYLPPSMGNSMISFKRGVFRYATATHTPLDWHSVKTHRIGYKKGLAFIEEGISAGVPVILLTALNRHYIYYHKNGFVEHSLRDQDTAMHFMTIVGVRGEPGAPELVLSDMAMLATIPYSHLHERWQSPLALTSGLCWFSPAPQTFSKTRLPLKDEASGGLLAGTSHIQAADNSGEV